MIKKRQSTSSLNNMKRKRSLRITCEQEFDLAMKYKENGNLSLCEKKLKSILKRVNSPDEKAQAAYELALLYCQLSDTNSADAYLRLLGFQYRLSPNVWKVNPRLEKSSLFGCYDNVLSPGLLMRAKNAFNEQSSFWSEHNYPTPNFFSYNVALYNNSKKNKKNKSKNILSPVALCDNLIQEISHFIKPLLVESFPHLDIDTRACSVEWWAHSRTTGSCAGHRLHYDTDERRLCPSNNSSPELHHPLVSCVLYLDNGGSSCAPTLVTNQTANDKGNSGWLCFPNENRLLAFDGKLLHGVIPFITPSQNNNDCNESESETVSLQPRVTLMLGWWDCNVATVKKQGSLLEPNMIMPSVDDSDWTSLFRSEHSSTQSLSATETGLHCVEGELWTRVSDSSHSTELSEELCHDTIFTGNWFVHSRSDINSEINKLLEPSSTKADTSDSTAVEWISMDELKRLRGEL